MGVLILMTTARLDSPGRALRSRSASPSGRSTGRSARSRSAPCLEREVSCLLPLPWERRSPVRRMRREGDTRLSPSARQGRGSGDRVISYTAHSYPLSYFDTNRNFKEEIRNGFTTTDFY